NRCRQVACHQNRRKAREKWRVGHHHDANFETRIPVFTRRRAGYPNRFRAIRTDSAAGGRVASIHSFSDAIAWYHSCSGDRRSCDSIPDQREDAMPTETYDAPGAGSQSKPKPPTGGSSAANSVVDAFLTVIMSLPVALRALVLMFALAMAALYMY